MNCQATGDEKSPICTVEIDYAEGGSTCKRCGRRLCQNCTPLHWHNLGFWARVKRSIFGHE